MLESLAASALGGFCAKVADECADRRLPLPSIIPISLAILYGALIGWLTSYTLLSSLFIALALASLLSGKINHPYHLLGAAVFTLVLVAFPTIAFEPWLFCLFLVSGLLDELELGGMARGPLAFLNSERLWTPLAALLAVLFLGAPLLFLLALVLFDITYRFGGWVVALEYPPKPVRAPARRRKR